MEQWNKCLQYATGDYVILASDDDVYDSDFLENILPLIHKYPQANVIRGRSVTINNEGCITDIDEYYPEFLPKDEFRYVWFKGMKPGIANYVFKREILQERGGFVNFPCAWASDDATILMMSDDGVVNSQNSVFYFRHSDISVSSQRGNTLLPKIKALALFSHWLQPYKEIRVCDDVTALQQKQIHAYYERKMYNHLWLIMQRMNIAQTYKAIKIIKEECILDKQYKSALTRAALNNMIMSPVYFMKSILH